ncbi:MAG: hypothetical protein ABIJ84_03120 [bacterium]
MPFGKPTNFYDFVAKISNCSINPYFATGLLNSSFFIGLHLARLTRSTKSMQGPACFSRLFLPPVLFPPSFREESVMRNFIFAALVGLSSVAQAQSQLADQAKMVEAQAKLISANAALITAIASANETNAKALQGIEQARSLSLDNSLKKAETFYGKKTLRENYMDLRKPRSRPSQEDLRRYSKAAAPDRLNIFEFNPVRAEIYWPPLLKEDQFSEYRLQIEGLFAQYLLDNNREGSIYQEVKELADKMQAELSPLIRDVPTSEYIRARKFLRSIAYESRFPNEIHGLAAN